MQACCMWKPLRPYSRRWLFLRLRSGMSITKDETRKVLQESGLRATAPRLAVLCLLCASETPLSHSEVLERLGETDFTAVV